MKRFFNTLITLVFVLLFQSQLNAQDCGDAEFSYEGTEFLVSFMKNSVDPIRDVEKNKLQLKLIVTAEEAANFTVEMPFLKTKTTHTVKPDSSAVIEIDNKMQIKERNEASNKIAHITSDKPISVVAFNKRMNTTDSYRVYPVSSLGCEYSIASFDSYSLFKGEAAIIATEDSTIISLESDDVPFIWAALGFDSDILLNKNEVFLLGAKFDTENLPAPYLEEGVDFTGDKLVSNKKIAVFSGHECAKIPDTIMACDHICEQLLPNSGLGKKYYLAPFHGRADFLIRMLFTEDNTDIKVNGEWYDMVGKNDVYHLDNNDIPKMIETSEPAALFQFCKGYKADEENLGDPFMLQILPEKYFKKSYNFNIPSLEDYEHYANIFVPEDAMSSLKLDGKKIKEGSLEVFGDIGYLAVIMKVKPGDHKIECDKPFGIYFYGFSQKENVYESYGHN